MRINVGPWNNNLVRCKMKLICTSCDCLRKISACGVKFHIRVSNLALKMVDYCGFGNCL